MTIVQVNSVELRGQNTFENYFCKRGGVSLNEFNSSSIWYGYILPVWILSGV